MKKKFVFGIGIFVGILLVEYALSCNFCLVREQDEEMVVGIIDMGLSKEYSNVVCNTNNYKTKETHGDKMINFVKKYCPNANIYFYDATDDKGRIKTQKIIDGLKWMRENSVLHINISLSSSRFSEEMQEWITENSKDTNIYASYSNIKQSADYPAMYLDVIGSTKDSDIAIKESDCSYKTNRIIILNNPFVLYRGNSYLSLVSMVNDAASYNNDSDGTIIHSEVLDDSEEYLTENFEGLTLRDEAKGKVKESEAQELLDEYGKDANIIIYDAEYTEQYEDEIASKSDC